MKKNINNKELITNFLSLNSKCVTYKLQEEKMKQYHSSYGRRSILRVPFHHRVHLDMEDPPGEWKTFLGTATDISENGVSVFLSNKLPCNRNFYFRGTLPGTNFAIKAPVETIWTKAGQYKGESGFFYGLLFSVLRRVSLIALTQFLNSKLGINEFKVVITRRREKRRKESRAFKLKERRVFDRRSKLKTFTLLVNGKDLDTGNYQYFPYADKAITDFQTTREVIQRLKSGEKPREYEKYIYARYCVNRPDTNLNAIEAAYKASQTFRYFSLAARRRIYDDMYDLLIKNKEEIIKLLILEGHPRKLAEWEFSGMEKGCVRETITFYKDEIRSEVGKHEKETVYWVRKPDGVVCLCPPRNASCSNSFTAALTFLAGNTLIVKPPLKNPVSTIYLWKEVVHKALKRNGAPQGTLNIVLGNSEKIMKEWLASPLVNDIIYFGESKKGLEIGVQAFQNGKKPILELSGNDMLFVWKDAKLDQAVGSLMDCFLGSTQICMVPKAAIIHAAIYKNFEEKLLTEVKKLKVGLPSDLETCLSPVTKIAEFFDFLQDAVNNGAELLWGGQRVNYRDVVDQKGTYIRPTLLRILSGEKAMGMKCVKEENFFPLLPLIRVSGASDKEIFEKMISIARSNEYGLRTSVWVGSNYYTRKFVKSIDNSGLLRINSRHVDFSLYLSTHGGTGKTGGPFGEMNYVWQKTSHLQGISRTRL